MQRYGISTCEADGETLCRLRVLAAQLAYSHLKRHKLASSPLCLPNRRLQQWLYNERFGQVLVPLCDVPTLQVYPAVEYDYTPTYLRATEGDYVHIQWTGSDANPPGNDGGANRSLMLQPRRAF